MEIASADNNYPEFNINNGHRNSELFAEAKI